MCLPYSWHSRSRCGNAKVIAAVAWFQAINQSPAVRTDLEVEASRVEIVKSPISCDTLESCSVEYRPLKMTSRLTESRDKTNFHSESGNSGAEHELSRLALASLTSTMSNSPKPTYSTHVQPLSSLTRSGSWSCPGSLSILMSSSVDDTLQNMTPRYHTRSETSLFQPERLQPLSQCVQQETGLLP